MLRTIIVATSVMAAMADPTQPEIAQAWQAESTGDGLPGATGLESYLYEEYPNKGGDPSGLRAHIFDYGASCKKFEISVNKLSHPEGSFYVNCDGVNCCVDDDIPDLKKWDLEAKSTAMHTVKYLGTVDTTELNNNPVKNAEAWSEVDKIPFTRMGENTTYYITRNGSDVITHRIDYTVSNNKKVPPGSILYGNFKVQHDIPTFRQQFMPPPECLKPNTLKCPPSKVVEWEKKHFKRSAARKGLF
jgi:hypothetical protein